MLWLAVHARIRTCLELQVVELWLYMLELEHVWNCRTEFIVVVCAYEALIQALVDQSFIVVASVYAALIQALVDQSFIVVASAYAALIQALVD